MKEIVIGSLFGASMSFVILYFFMVPGELFRSIACSLFGVVFSLVIWLIIYIIKGKVMKNDKEKT